jgi:hypothetical protein
MIKRREIMIIRGIIIIEELLIRRCYCIFILPSKPV